jgi:hypothetical protein
MIDRRKSTSILFTVALALTTLGAGDLLGQGQRPSPPRRVGMLDGREVVEGEVIVRYRAQGRIDRERAELQADSDAAEQLGRRLQRLRSRSLTTRELIETLRANPAIELVEPNYIIRANAVPNDPSFGSQYALLNTGQTVEGSPGTPGADIDAVSAWNVTTGSRQNVVAILDTGIDYNHLDLAANVFTAPHQFSVTVGATTVTCAAGTHGFNAITGTCDPLDDNFHGTHVAGIVGAVGNNNRGVSGVNWTANLMSLKMLGADGTGTVADAIKAIEWVIKVKAALGSQANVRVLNASWSGGVSSAALDDQIAAANNADMLFVASAGSDTSNNDVVANYPASSPNANVISVAAVDHTGQLATYSNYGAASVDIAAPGTAILSTYPSDQYARQTGTSMAAAHVSGAAELVLAACPGLSTAQLKQALMTTVDPASSLSATVVSNGRLNVDSALRSCAPAQTANEPIRGDHGDYDGDGKSDLTFFRPITGSWWARLSAANFTTYIAQEWGLPTDRPTPGDYDGDGRTDLAFYRPAAGVWWMALSSTNFSTAESYQWGVETDIPMPADYDGDNKTDIAIYRPSAGVWWVLLSSTNFSSAISRQWGVSTDTPVPADYDGDGKADMAIYRPATGVWWILTSSTNFSSAVSYQWGISTDTPLPADYDGDGQADVAFYRRSTGVWQILLSSTNFSSARSIQWGVNADMPVPADYDGDGKADLAIYRGATGAWWLLLSTTNSFATYQWGTDADIPMSAARP